tara:strand:- start:2055 stop:2909 length:855 start_codon:yes stop_codon:yes gene_type:complete
MTALEEDSLELKKIRQIISDLEEEPEKFLPTWIYICIFTLPGAITFLLMSQVVEADYLFSGIVALAVMNGSINSIIAILTIRLDGHSQDALDHLDTIMTEMENLEVVLNNASQKVDTFTTDLDEARNLFRKIGMDLDELDLEPIADTVQQLKDNKDGLSEVLSHLKDVNVSEYINQAKRIDWKEMLGAAEEIMGFIKSKNAAQERVDNYQPVPVPKMDFGYDQAFFEEPEENEFYEEDEESYPIEEEFDIEPEEEIDEAPEPKLVLAPPKKRRPNLNLAPPKKS